ncbi:MAG: phage portal protein [Hyphomicrobium sp.]|jgi:HK97 family phage portal protein
MSRILDAIGRLLPARSPRREAKASATGPLIAWEPLGQPVWSPRDYAAFAREGFMQNAIVYRSVRMIAEAAASVPLLAYDGDDEIDRHPLLDLIARPSPDHTATDFLEAWYGFLLVSGNAYVEAVGVGGQLRELYVLRPDRMKVIPGPSGWPEAFEYSANGTCARFAEEPLPGVRPILHTRLFHPDNDHYGMSPIEAAAVAIDIHNEASAWNKALLDNSARPSGALVYGGASGNLTAEQFKRLRGELEEAFQGARNAGRPMLLEGGLDWKPLSLSPKDMDFIAAKHAAARDIALALGVPPMLLGIPGDNTYSNYGEAQRAFWRGTVLPLVSRMTRAFSAWLVPAYGGGLELRPDLDQVEGLSAEREALWARIERASFLTQDEKRAAVGYGPSPLVGAGDSPAGSRQPAPFGGEAVPFVKYSPDQPRVSAGNSGGGQWTDSGGGSSGGVPVAQVATGTLNDAGESERLIQLAQADEPAGYRIDVREHEGRNGGHTIAEHVARPDTYLLARVRGERGPTLVRKRAGSFPSVEAANKLVSATLSSNRIQPGEVFSNRQLVGRVSRGKANGAFLTLEVDTKTGREAFASSEYAEPYLRDTFGVAVLIVHDRSDPIGFSVVSAYPRNP